MFNKTKIYSIIILVVMTVISFAACGSAPAKPSAQTPPPTPTNAPTVEDKAQAAQDSCPPGALDCVNYTQRLKLKSDPTNISWCTVFPTNPGQQPFTIAVVGTMTSSGKRPFQKTQTLVQNFGSVCDPVNGCRANSGATWYSPEVPSPIDSMFGDSSEYKYGFNPDGSYYEVTGMEMYCTSVPTVWQMNETKIVFETDATATALTRQAEEALKNGDIEAASELLKQVGK